MRGAKSSGVKQLMGTTLALLVAVGCQTKDPTVTGLPQFSHTADGEASHVTLCKVGSDASFDVSVDGGAAQAVNLLDGECTEVADRGPDKVFVTITENVAPGQRLDRITEERFDGQGSRGITQDLTGTNAIDTWVGVDIGHVVTFFNTDLAFGRMTGGGGQIILGDVRVTKGLTLHCDITLSNNLEINWPDNKWHLEKESLVNVNCVDDPNVDPTPPAAPFDTFNADAIGSLNGVDGSYIQFTFVDSGEPGGKADKAAIQIWAVGANPATDTPVLNVPLMLTDNGNLQAHFDQPHGNKNN